VQQLIGVLHTARAKPADIVVRDAAKVLERPVHN
jgi:hypothetical protein